MKDNFLNSWKTTLIGVVILGLFIYNNIVKGSGLDLTDAAQIINILVSVGFIIGKDATTSHSFTNSKGIDNPDPKKEEK